MEGQRQRTGGGSQRTGGGRRRRRKNKSKSDNKGKVEPVLIAARRPDSPRLLKVSNRSIAASAKPKTARADKQDAENSDRPVARAAEKPRREARIIQAKRSALTDEEMRSQRLLERLLLSEGRTAITQAVDALDESGIDVPEEQEPQLQLLEHVDERRACEAIQVIARLLELEPPVKRPILDQRLRRLEDEGEDSETRDRAAALRRSIRVA